MHFIFVIIFNNCIANIYVNTIVTSCLTIKLFYSEIPSAPTCADCHANADCDNDVCTCKNGFAGNGFTCSGNKQLNLEYML